MKEYDLALEAVKTAGQFLEENYDPTVDSQIGKDIKLSSDRKSEAIIIEILKETGLPILSEEAGLIEGAEHGLRWIVDPLDGSANYWKGLKELACTSVALWKGYEPVLGAIYRFHTDELFSGIVGKGAWLNDKAIKTSKVDKTKDAIFATGFPVKRDYGEESLKKFVKQVQSFKKVRMLGAAAVMGSLVAAGKIDAYLEEQIMLWDIAASSAIVNAAGGYVEIEHLQDYQCICKLFANKKLYEDFKRNEG